MAAAKNATKHRAWAAGWAHYPSVYSPPAAWGSIWAEITERFGLTILLDDVTCLRCSQYLDTVSVYLIIKGKSDVLCANIIKNQAHWRDKTKGLILHNHFDYFALRVSD